ncbi:unnamed protein product [Rotaria sp. Silwood2]|nr:unnamed protein product [Rotaria sp. Silwood2]
MDYSFLIGVHHVDAPTDSGGDRAAPNIMLTPSEQTSVQPKRMMYSTPMDTIQVEFDEHNKPDDHLVKSGGIPARTARGQRLLLYVGIIDILQSYHIRKKLEHTFKSVLTDGNQISVTNPSFYSERFQKFLFTTVFRKAPPLRESPVKRRSRLSKMLQGSEQEKDMISTPIIMKNDRGGLHTSPIGRRSFDITPVHLHQSAASSPKRIGNNRTYLSNMPLYANHASPSSSTQTQATSSHVASYYSSSPSTRTNTFTRKLDIENNKRDSSTTVYSSSHKSDSLYNEPTRHNSAKILTTSFNNRLKIMHSPSHNRRDLPKASIDTDNDDNVPRQILLPIGGGIVGKLASSATNLSYHDKSTEHSPVHRQYRNPSASGINDDMVCY